MAEGWFTGETAGPLLALLPVWLNAETTATNSGTSITSPAFTPPAGTLLLVAAVWNLDSLSGVSSTTTGISDTIGGLTWTEITPGWHGQTLFGETRSFKTSVFWAVTGSSPPNGSVTITSTLATCMHLEVVKVPGAKASGPVGTSGLNHLLGSFGSSQTLTVTTGATPAATSCMVAVFGEGMINANVQPTDDAAYTNLFWVPEGGSANRSNIDASYDTAGNNTVTWTMAANSNQFWNYDGILLEIVPADGFSSSLLSADPFTHADSATALLGATTPTGGQTWTLSQGTSQWGYSSNKAYASSVSASGSLVVDVGHSAVIYTCDFTTGSSVDGTGISFWEDGAGTGNFGQVCAFSSGWFLRYSVGGGNHNVTSAGTPAANTTYTITVVTPPGGGTVLVYINGTLMLSGVITDPAVISNTKFGLDTRQTTGPTCRWDNFSVSSASTEAWG